MNSAKDKYNSPQGHLSEGQIIRYQKGRMSDPEMHRAQQHLAGCELCSDALEGYALLNEQEREDSLATLKERLRKRVSDRKHKSIAPAWKWAVAASFLLLLSVAIFFLTNNSFQAEPIAHKEDIEEHDTSSTDAEDSGTAMDPGIAYKQEELSPETETKNSNEQPEKETSLPPKLVPPAESVAEEMIIVELDLEMEQEYEMEPEYKMEVEEGAEIEEFDFSENNFASESPVGRGTFNQPDISEELSAPQPRSGMRLYRKYLEENLRYPVEASEAQAEGEIKVLFTIETDGSLSNFKVLDSLGYGMEEEAIRLIKEGPEWKPLTTTEGKSFPQQMIMKVSFELE